MSELSEQIAASEAEQAVRPGMHNRLFPALSGAVAVLAAVALSGSKPSPKPEANALRSSALVAQTVPESTALDLVDGIHVIGNFSKIDKQGIPSLTDEPPVPSTLNPTRLTIPQAVKNYMSYNTLLLRTGGGLCSGAAIRNQRGNVIGIATAEHCGLNDAASLSQEGSNGKNYEIWTKPIKVYRGKNLEHLETVAEIDEFIVPNERHTPYQDLALGIATGSTAAQVLQAYRQSSLSDRAINHLSPGTTIYMGSYPGYQPVNWTDNLQRQMFAMTALGPATVRSTGVGQRQRHAVSEMPKRLHVFEAAMPTDEQGAVCSFGASGSEGFVMVNGQVRTIGVLSNYENLTNNNVPDRVEIGVSKYLPYDRSSTPTAICNFAYQLGRANDTEVQAVQSIHQIPGYIESLKLTDPDRISSQLEDPHTTKTYLDGVVGVNTGNSIKWISNPLIFYDPKIKFIAVAYANRKNHGKGKGLSFISGYADHLSGVFVYPHDSSGIVSLLSLTKSLRFQPNRSSHTNSSFVSNTRQHFGTLLKHRPNNMVGGALQFTPAGDKLAIIPRTDPLARTP